MCTLKITCVVYNPIPSLMYHDSLEWSTGVLCKILKNNTQLKHLGFDIILYGTELTSHDKLPFALFGNSHYLQSKGKKL